MLEGVELFARPLRARCEREDGLPQLRVIDLRTGELAPRRVPRAGLLGCPGAQPASSTRRCFRFSYQSLVTPRSVFDYDMARRRARRCSSSSRCWAATTRRATRRSASSRPRRTARRCRSRSSTGRAARGDGRGPLLLYGYGAYGYPLPVDLLLERG